MLIPACDAFCCTLTPSEGFSRGVNLPCSLLLVMHLLYLDTLTGPS